MSHTKVQKNKKDRRIRLGDYLASQTKVGQPFVTSRWYFQPPGQSSALGSVTCGQISPALLRRSWLVWLMALSITTRRMNERVKNNIKFHELKLSLAMITRRAGFRFAIISPITTVKDFQNAVKREVFGLYCLSQISTILTC